jgi:hypothetical protein
MLNALQAVLLCSVALAALHHKLLQHCNASQGPGYCFLVLLQDSLRVC